MSNQKLIIAKNDSQKRVDLFLVDKFTNFTRSNLSKLFDAKHILLNNQPIKPSYRLKSGDEIEVNTSLLTAKPQKIKLPIIYEDDNVIVINKPAGVLTHSKGALNLEATVASFIKNKITDKALVGNRAGIVHRLDRSTSGVIITTKNSVALKYLQKQFSQRKVKKTYIAIVEGLIKPIEGRIDESIIRNPKKPQTFKVDRQGKLAQTEYKVLKTFRKNNHSYTLLELKPQTGRTHQLRVHLSYIGHPILGDQLYGHEGPEMYLHAKKLEIILPEGNRKIFKAPLPKLFKSFQSIK